jgi:hypothetical protein
MLFAAAEAVERAKDARTGIGQSGIPTADARADSVPRFDGVLVTLLETNGSTPRPVPTTEVPAVRSAKVTFAKGWVGGPGRPRGLFNRVAEDTDTDLDDVAKLPNQVALPA